MSKIMLINVTHAEESRVGIVSDGVLTSFEIEAFSREHLKGNIYKGVVRRIHPALEAAFVDIGAERDAFLPLDEICFRNAKGATRANGNGGDGRRRPKVTDVLKSGEEVLVQIVKEQFANKPPTLSTFYSLAGRYLVLLPGSDDTGISRRIEGSERQRIRELVEKLNPPEGYGLIVRTVTGFDQGERELQRDLTYLLRLWDRIQQAAASRKGPALIYREHDLVLRNIRDYFTPDIDEIHIDNEEVFERAREFFREVMPEREGVLRLYDGAQPIFSRFNVEAQIESVYKRRVSLKSGGSIVIDGTEALTAIDVNSGRSVRGPSQEETAYRTNLEAANEIARQLRLRDLGGLIVIDFIDMRNPQHVAEVERALRNAMHEDKARHEIGHISQFGLLEVSRQRLRPAAVATTYVACQACDGYGLVRTTESAALVALRKIHHRVSDGDIAAVKVSLPPDVAVYLLNQKREDLAELERRYATRIQVVLNERLMPHQSEFEARRRSEADVAEQPKVRLGGVAVIGATAAAAPADASQVGEGGTGGSTETPAGASSEQERSGKRRRRRRGRRRGRGGTTTVATSDVVALEGAPAAPGASGEDSVSLDEMPEDFALDFVEVDAPAESGELPVEEPASSGGALGAAMASTEGGEAVAGADEAAPAVAVALGAQTLALPETQAAAVIERNPATAVGLASTGAAEEPGEAIPALGETAVSAQAPKRRTRTRRPRGTHAAPRGRGRTRSTTQRTKSDTPAATAGREQTVKKKRAGRAQTKPPSRATRTRRQAPRPKTKPEGAEK